MQFFLQLLYCLYVHLFCILILDFIVHKNTNFCLSAQKFNPLVLSLHLYYFRAWIDGPKEFLQIPQLKLLLFWCLFFVNCSQVSIYLFVTHFLGPMHKLIHEERHNSPLKVVLLLNWVRDFSFDLLGFDGEVCIDHVEYFFIDL